MRTDSALRYEAMDVLTRTFGPVDAERFISMVKRDTFDYTEWRRGLWNDVTIEEIYAEATAQSDIMSERGMD
jgi:hypothetical protein